MKLAAENVDYSKSQWRKGWCTDVMFTNMSNKLSYKREKRKRETISTRRLKAFSESTV